jgi:hypothetical protein
MAQMCLSMLKNACIDDFSSLCALHLHSEFDVQIRLMWLFRVFQQSGPFLEIPTSAFPGEPHTTTASVMQSIDESQNLSHNQNLKTSLSAGET